jgi:hypothetical protein
VVVAGSSEGNLGTDAVTSESGHTDLVIVHESSDVICVIYGHYLRILPTRRARCDRSCRNYEDRGCRHFSGE